MPQTPALVPTRILPAPLPTEWTRAVSAWSNKLDVHGTHHSIAAADAPSPEKRAMLQRRSARLSSCLLPAGPEYAARVMGELGIGMKKRQRSPQEADVAFAQLVDGLKDLPMFAIDAAKRDFLGGTIGDGWMPDLSDIRPVVVAKMQAVAAEKRQIDRIAEARVRPAVDLDRKAAVLAMARSAIKTMPEEGKKAEDARVPVTRDTLDTLMAKTNARFDAEKAARRRDPTPEIREERA